MSVKITLAVFTLETKLLISEICTFQQSLTKPDQHKDMRKEEKRRTKDSPKQYIPKSKTRIICGLVQLSAVGHHCALIHEEADKLSFTNIDRWRDY